jgi:hypothetical protein
MYTNCTSMTQHIYGGIEGAGKVLWVSVQGTQFLPSLKMLHRDLRENDGSDLPRTNTIEKFFRVRFY